MAGRVSGKLVEVDTIREAAVEEAQEDLILLVRGASGEEEVGAAGRRLKGVILQQALPHLSHLGALPSNLDCCSLYMRNLIFNQVM